MPRITATCLYCGKPIKSGRVDKKFCDSGCKDSYNNDKKESERGEIRKVDLKLKKNRRILKKLFNPKRTDYLIKRETLIREGFEFDYHTHFIITKIKENTFTFCYDFGYREVKENQFQIIESYKK